MTSKINMETELFNWGLGDKLPTIYDAAVCIFKQCKSPKSSTMKTVLHAYAVELRAMWVRSFGKEHVLAKSNIIKRQNCR